MNKRIKAIIFDLGNVLVNLDYETAYRRFENLLNIKLRKGDNIPSLFQAIKKYEKGEIPTDEFLNNLQAINPSASTKDLTDAWNSLILDLPFHRLDLLKTLKKDFPLYLLSNINALHEACMERLIIQMDASGFPENYFEKYFYSHHIGMRKPEDNIYQFVQNEIGFDPKEILFIDDMKENIESARRAGWHAALHDPENDIADMIKIYLS